MRGDTAADDDAAALESADCFCLLLDVDGASTLALFKLRICLLMRGDTAADDDAAALESADFFGFLIDVDGASMLVLFKSSLLAWLNRCVSGAETLSTSLREVLALEALWGWVRAERFVPLSGGTSSFAVWAPSASGTCEVLGASCGITSATVRSKHATSSSFSFRLHGLPSNAFVHLIRSLFL